jgi:hypothetical protein
MRSLDQTMGSYGRQAGEAAGVPTPSRDPGHACYTVCFVSCLIRCCHCRRALWAIMAYQNSLFGYQQSHQPAHPLGYQSVFVNQCRRHRGNYCLCCAAHNVLVSWSRFCDVGHSVTNYTHRCLADLNAEASSMRTPCLRRSTRGAHSRVVASTVPLAAPLLLACKLRRR